MDVFKVMSKNLVCDQKDTVRLLKDKEYIVKREYDDSFLIIDETKNEVIFNKRNFYYVPEE